MYLGIYLPDVLRTMVVRWHLQSLVCR